MTREELLNKAINWFKIIAGDMLYCEYKHMNDRRFNSFEEAALPGIEYTLDNLI